MAKRAKEPKATRPTVPGYEFSAKKGLLPWTWAVKRLKKSRQYWIATARLDGTPHLMIIWGLWLDESFWFSTGSASRKGRNLAANPKCVIGTDNAAKGVILEGAVERIDPKGTDYDRFAKAYKKKYHWTFARWGSPSIASGRNSGSGCSRKSSTRQQRGGPLIERPLGGGTPCPASAPT